MYVCLCNALTGRQIVQALTTGARSSSSVYRSLGCRPQCGKCVPTVRQMVERHKRAIGT